MNTEENINLENFETLLPDISEKESKKTYLATLEWALKNESIKNLAITGAYGSGKSSILKTFWKDFKKKEEVLEISAATFNGDEKFLRTRVSTDVEGDGEKEDDNVSIENVLEQNIMQQMFYKVEPDKIPLSRFNRIQSESKSEVSIIIDITLYLLTFLLIYFSFKYNWIPNLYINIINGDYNFSTSLIYIFICSSGIVFTVFVVFRALQGIKNFRLSTLGIGNTTIELNTDNSNTVFNKYLDEIIYFFKQTKFNIVVFEDLDRFNNLLIYERLRGLNHLLNQSDELVDRNIVFVYALRDDIFSETDDFQEVQNRTKFFDFIMPTVRIMHSSNSESILQTKLKGYIKSEDAAIQNDGLSAKVLTDISLFINDMRILKNICNEYIIYRSALKQSGILQDKLFAIIVYKNIYPKDFSDLLNSKGNLYNLINSKKSLLVKYKLKYEEELEELKKILIQVNNDFADSLDELVIIYLRKINLLEVDYYLQIGNSTYQISDKSSMHEFLLKIIEISSSKPNIIIRRSNYNITTLNFNDFCTANETSVDIIIRAKAILNKKDNKVDSINRKISEINRCLLELKTLSFSELVRQANDMLDFDFENRELLKALVLQGWIDEDYDEYITYFYEGALSKEDIIFLRSVRLNNPLDFDYKLKNENEVQKKLSKEHFFTTAILNYQLLTYLLDIEQEDYMQKRNYLISFISKDISLNFDFISGFIENSIENTNLILTKFIKGLSGSNSYLWNDMKLNINDKDKEIQFFLLLYNSLSAEELSLLNNNSNLTHFIEQCSDFLSWWGNPDIEKLKQHLEILNVRFTTLDYVENKTELIDMIIENDFYELTSEMINTLLQNTGEINYDLILENPSEALKVRIEEGINEFILNILLVQSSYHEPNEMFLILLNHTRLEEQLKLKLIEKWSGRITDINEVKSEVLFEKILESNKMEPVWINICRYYSALEEGESLELLQSFLIHSANFEQFVIDTEQTNCEEIEEDCFQGILNLILASEDIEHDQLLTLIGNVRRKVILSSPDSIGVERYAFLIEQNILSWNEDILELLRSKSINLALNYFMLNKESLSYEEINSLIINSKIPWNKDVFDYLIDERDEKEAYKYITSFKDNRFIEKIAEVEFDSLLVLDVLRDLDISMEIRLDLVNSLEALDIPLEGDIKKWLLEIFRNEGFEFVNNFLSKSIIEQQYLPSLEEQENIAFILHGCMKNYNYSSNEIYRLLSELSEPFSLLSIPSRRNIEFKNSSDTFKLLHELEEKQIVASVQIKGDFLHVNNKRNIMY
ncbi:hypothetical protein [Sporosarcina sp. NPDC096371]|uniref:YobI family P-loop NTPase n=1 Tax=Sporosarcina sp. NPDC096371 TaxID=3364530 RepID=UPI003816298C